MTAGDRRRGFLAALRPALGAAGTALADNPKNQPPNVPEWTQDARRRRRRARLRPALQAREERHPPHRGVADSDAGILGQLHAAA